MNSLHLSTPLSRLAKKPRLRKLVALLCLALSVSTAAPRAQCNRPAAAVTWASSTNMGKSVVCIGDYNGNGHEDYAVGDPDRRSGNGAFAIYDGRTHARIIVFPGLIGERLGASLAYASGRLFVGAPGHAGGRGRVYWRDVRGSSSGSYFGSLGGERFGEALAALDDIDGDNIPDVAIGAPGWGGYGRCVVVRTASPNLSYTPATTGTFGASVAAGDVDDDGQIELVIGNPTRSVSALSRAGTAQVFDIAAGFTLRKTITGSASNDRFGSAVATIRQGDGRAAFAIAATPTNADGRVEVHDLISGRRTTLTEGRTGYHIGVALANVGDWDEDGYEELGIGSRARFALPNTPPLGTVRLVNGRTFKTHYVYRAAGEIGASIAALPDFEQDGMPELLAGAPNGTAGGGSIWVLRPAVAPARDVVMITEIAWANTPCVELTNHGRTRRDMTDWRIRWETDFGPALSTPLNETIAPGQSIVVHAGPTCGTPPGVRRIKRLRIPTGRSPMLGEAIALLNSKGLVLDEVVLGPSAPAGYRGRVRGLVPKFVTSSLQKGYAERFWGLDSNGGADWTDQNTGSLGLENRSSGARGTDTLPRCQVVINETAHQVDFVELYNPGNGPTDLQGWSFLVSFQQCVPQVPITPWTAPTLINPNAFHVFGEGAPPAEKPRSVGYTDISALGFNIPWGSREYSGALYDGYGRLVDLIITTGRDNEFRHNHPRAPYPTGALTGTAPQRGTSPSLGRNPSSADTDRGSDWFAQPARSMGLPNPAGSTAGHAQSLDARVNATSRDGGLTIILNAGPSASGAQWALLISPAEVFGTGPIFGLSAATVDTRNLIPGYYGALDPRGSARIDLPAGSFPCGTKAEMIAYAITTTGVIYTKVLDYEACGCP